MQALKLLVAAVDMQNLMELMWGDGDLCAWIEQSRQ